VSIFVDTSAWYAVMDRGDRRHEQATRFYLDCAGQTELLTSSLVLAETWTLVTAHIGRPAALLLWGLLREARMTIGTAIPEPSAALLGGLGLLGLLRRRSR
jgi:predicted nucleic acid-binding protein